MRVRVRLTRRLWSWAQQLVVVGAQGLVGGARRAAPRRAVRCAVGGARPRRGVRGAGACHTSKRFSRVGMSTAVMSTSCLHRVPVWSLRKRSMMGTSLGSTYTIGSP